MTPQMLPDLSPIPFGVRADTGDYLPDVSDAALARPPQDSCDVLRRAKPDGPHLGLTASRDADDLKQAGWGIVFPATMKEQDVAAVRQNLQPLLDLRRAEAGALYKEFADETGYTDGLGARAWLESLGSGLASVDPRQGVPYYLLLVGSPEDIPFSFQFELDTFFAVGRLYFNHVDEYGTYAENMARQAAAAAPLHDRTVALVATRNPGDKATALFHDGVAKNFDGSGGDPVLGQAQGFALHATLAAEATKSNLLNVLGGASAAGRPALLVTGSHGVAFSPTDPAIRDKQGAILTQEWGGRPSPVAPATYLTAAEIATAGATPGMVHFFFACYSGACPAVDTYSYSGTQQPLPVAPQQFLSRLPQQMLLNGAQAVVGHVDRVWANSFQNGRRVLMVQKLRDPITRMLQGHRVGDAMDCVNQQWSSLAAVLGETLRQKAAVPALISPARLANAMLERDDARNYIVLGDPAARLRLQ